MAQTSSGGFNVTIRALDEVTSVAERIKKELKSLGEASQPQLKTTNSLFDKVGLGIKETSRGLVEIGSRARETGRRLGEAFRPIAELTGIGGIAAVASIGGITLALDKYARTGANLLRTSQAMGIGVQTLQTFQHGARLAGSDAGALTDALDTLNQKLHDAAWGRDVEAIGVFKQLKISIWDTNGQIRKAQDVLPEIADAVKRNLIDPYVAGEIAAKTLGASARVLLPYLRDGAEGLAQFNRDAERYGANMSPAAVRQTHEFERAQSELALALQGLGNSIAEKVLPVIIPMVKGMSDWVSQNKDWIATGIGEEIEKFSKWVKSVDWNGAVTGVTNLAKGFAGLGTAMGTILDGLKWMEEHPTVTGMVLGGLAGGRFGGGYGAAAGAVVGGLTGNYLGASEHDKAWNEVRTKWFSDHGFTDKRSLRQVQQDFEAEWAKTHPGGSGGAQPSWWQRNMPGWLGGGVSGGVQGPHAAATLTQPGPPSAEDPRGMIPVIRASALRHNIDPDVAVRVARSEGLLGFKSSIPGEESYGAFQLNTQGGLGNEFQRETNLDPRDPKNEIAGIDYALRYASTHGWGAFHGARNTGIGNYQGIGIRGNAAGFASVTPLTDPPPAGVPIIGAPGQEIKWTDKVFSDPAAATLSAPVTLAPNQAAGNGGDSSHSVAVTFENAPMGMRSRIIEATGDADFALRTQHALSAW